jgi:hypothetical protein
VFVNDSKNISSEGGLGVMAQRMCYSLGSVNRFSPKTVRSAMTFLSKTDIYSTQSVVVGSSHRFVSRLEGLVRIRKKK